MTLFVNWVLTVPVTSLFLCEADGKVRRSDLGLFCFRERFTSNRRSAQRSLPLVCCSFISGSVAAYWYVCFWSVCAVWSVFEDLFAIMSLCHFFVFVFYFFIFFILFGVDKSDGRVGDSNMP